MIPTLTPDERIQARRQAEDWTISARRAAIRTESRFPASITRLITVLCLALLAAAFTPSAIRLYDIGSSTFRAGVPAYGHAPEVVGLATIASAEIGQVVFSLALAIFPATRRARLLLYAGSALATTIALCGNIQVALPGHASSPFAWFEAISPPLLTLSTAYVLKEQLLAAIEAHHAHARAALDPSADPRFMNFWATALRAAHLAKPGQVREARKLNRGEWLQLINTEMREEQWFVKEETHPDPFVIAPSANGRRDHAHAPD